MVYGQEWIRQFCVLDGNSSFMDKDAESFGILFNAGVCTTVRADGVDYELNSGEVMFLIPYVSVEHCPESKRTELCFLEFFLDGRMNFIPQENINEFRLRFENFFSMLQKATVETVRLFEFLRQPSKDKELMGDTCYVSAVILLLIEVVKSNIFQAKKGVNWSNCNADGWAQYVENRGSNVILCLRMDYRDSDGKLHMVGSRNILLLDEKGAPLPVEKPIESFSFILPKNFRGMLYIPFEPCFREFNFLEDSKTAWFLPGFNEMVRLIYYFYTVNDMRKISPLLGTEDVYLGAMRLVKATHKESGAVLLDTVLSLSSTDPRDTEKRYLDSKYMGTVFNRQYYYPQGMRVSFADGLIRLRQEVAGGSPFVCTNMGCDAEMVPDYPPEITRVIDYVLANSKQIHTVRELADIANLSESRFKEKFRRCVGTSPIQFAENIRIREACRMLGGKISITDISFELGYSSAAHFSTAFRRAMGMTPSEYRRNLYISDSV